MREAVGRGWCVAQRSKHENVHRSTSIYVCDTLGELPLLYEVAGLAFVGGSLVPLGGHSLLEGAQVPSGCALLHGPHIENIKMSCAHLAETRPPAARCVHNARELTHAVHELLVCPRTLNATRRAASQAATVLEHGLLTKIWSRLESPLALPSCRY